MDLAKVDALKNITIQQTHTKLTVILEEIDNLDVAVTEELLTEDLQNIEKKVEEINQPYKEYFGDFFTAISLYQKEGDEIVKFALQLIALTFVRKNELLGSRWDEFDLDEEIWKIPASRMKMRVEHIIPLSRQAVGLLRYIKKNLPK